MTPPNQLSTLKSKHKSNLTPTIHLTLSPHFVDQWRAYFTSSHGREKESKIRGIVIKAIRDNPLYGCGDRFKQPGRFDVWIATRKTKAILEITDFGWVGVTVLDPNCAEVLLEKAGGELAEIGRRLGARLKG